MTDLPDYTKKVVLDQTVPPSTLAQVDHRKLAGADLVVPTVAAAIPISIENPAIKNATATPTIANTIPISVENPAIKNATATPTAANSVPVSVENTAIAFDPVNNEFYIRSQNAARPVYVDLQSILGTALVGRDWSADFAKLQSIPTDPATESGKLTTLAAIAFILRATTPTLYNTTMTNANQEYSQALSANTKKFLVATRDRSAFRLAFETGKVAASTAPFMDVLANEIYFEDMVNLTSITVYFASASAGKIIEIIEWV